MIADTVYATYAQKPGSEHIASLDACRGLEQLVRRHRPRRVLEVGSGIGTLTDLLAQTLDPDAVLVSLEDNPYCLEQRRLNLGPRLGRASLLPDLGALKREIFDLVVVDGGLADASVVPFVAHRGLVFVEGFRGAQRQFLKASGRPCACVNIRAMHRGGSSYGLDAWGGAY
jgi:Predicted O-methyltransferase